MLIPSALAALLLANMQGATDPLSAHSQLCSTINSYIVTNAQIIFAWTAALPVPPFSPDPIVIANGLFTSCAIQTSPSFVPNQIASVSDFSTKIQTTFGATGTFNITVPGFITAPSVIGVANPLVLNMTGLATPPAALLAFATQIITWVKTHVGTPPPVAGTHPPYVGTGTIATIL